jgi:arginine N-succinyltransferase
MLTIRPIHPEDAGAFIALHKRADLMAARALIDESAQAFDGDGAMPQRFVFVLVDSVSDELLGAATLAGSTGIDLPRHSYRGGVVVHASAELKLFNRVDTLLLCNDHTGSAELTLPLMASADSAQAPQRLLIDAMLLFVAQQRDRFASTLLAALPGVSFEGGGSPFWSALGRHFHAGALPRDDAFFPSPERSHIARLMPKHPLYSSFLGADAQACIGQRALPARTAADALQAQGFRHRGHVDVFDAGPIVEVDVADLHAVQTSRVLPVRVSSSVDSGEARSCLVAGVGASQLGAGLVQATRADGALLLAEADAQALGVAPGQRVRVLLQGDGAMTNR